MGFCNEIIPTCDTCYVISNGGCGNTIAVNIGLTPITTYYIELIDKFDIVTQTSVVTDVNGNFTLEQTWANGSMEMLIYSDSGYTVPVTFVISTITYKCIIFK